MPTQIGSIGLGLQDIQQLVLLYVIGSPWFLPLKSATCRSDSQAEGTNASATSTLFVVPWLSDGWC